MAEHLDTPQHGYLVGIDLGVQSVGWVVIDLDADGQPCAVRSAGVRCFESATGSEREIELGKDESRNKERRDARQHRRQLWRRARRLQCVFHVLQSAGLLPPGPAATPEQRDELIKALDATLRAQRAGGHVEAQTLTYRLRAEALDRPLDPFALGRALYHLAQRRGFLSNKKAKKEKDEEGKVKEGIAQLHKAMIESGARSLGEYFARLDPHDARIRGRWTARAMYLDEFEKIFASQAPHHPALTDEFKSKLHRAMFFQRPLKSQKGLVGRCDLEPGQRRAPLGCLEAQRFRYWQKINDLEYVDPWGEVFSLAPPDPAKLSAERRDLAAEQRRKLAEAFELNDELTFAAIARTLGLKKPKDAERDYEFNLARGGNKKLLGNRTATAMRKALGERWEQMPAPDQARLVDEILAFEHEDALARRLEKAWGFDADTAARLASVHLEPGYASLSRRAMRRLLPLMQQGIRFRAAVERIPEYTQRSAEAQVHDELPPLAYAVPQLRNPVVARALSEMRKVLNALVRRYGKPALVRIEMARDMKKSRRQRGDRIKEIRGNEKAREEAKRRILAETGIKNPSPGDILKVLLAEESNWECPYTGRTISIGALVGDHPQFDVEHIIPFSRSLDNSFANKTLCYHEENRNRKRNHTPFEAYGADDQRWHEILARVKRFRGPAARAKYCRFLQKEMDLDFTQRQLVDTRYICRLATDYVGLLYGGQIERPADGEGPGVRRVQVSPGGATKFLRDEWKLNSILGDGDEKTRTDHRHHAVDAVAIALTSPRTVGLLARSAEQADRLGRRLLSGLEPPWPGFLDDVRRAIEAIKVSYRVRRRVRGALHKETLYSKTHKHLDEKTGKVVECRHVRKRLEALSDKEIADIVDPRIRAIVQEHLDHNGGDLKKAFADPNQHPYTRAHDGRVIPIHKVRVRVNVSTITIGSGPAARHVQPGNNHHMEIIAVTDRQGRERWEGHVVSLYEATRRLRQRQPVVQRDHGPGKRFVFSLAGGEYVEMEHEPGRKDLYRVIVISGKQVEFRLHSDARPITELRKISRARVRRSCDLLRTAKARKVLVDPLGNVRPAND